MAKRKLTKEQKKAASERLAKARLARGHDGSAGVDESIRDFPEDHPFHWKKVKEWIKYNKQLLSEYRKSARKGVKGAEAQLKSTDAYIRNLEAYLRKGDYVDDFYGQDQDKRVTWKCIAPAYNDDGTMKRTVGVWYEDIGRWTKEMDDEYHGRQ